MGEYYIGVDRDGQPYIAHALFNRKGSTKQNHKYIKKIVDGTKTRYFYTKQELDAYYKGLKDKTKDTTEKVKDKVKEIANDPFGAKKREEAIETYNKAMNKGFKAVGREYNKESFIKDIPYMPSDASKTELTKSTKQLNPGWKRTNNPDGSTTFEIRSDKERKSIQSLIDERKSPTTAQEMNRQMDLIDEYNSVTDQTRKEGLAYEEEFNKLRKEYAKTPLGMIDIASNAVGYVADKTNEKVKAAEEKVKAAEEKRYAKRIDKDNWNMEQQVMELRGQGNTFHGNPSRKTGTILTEDAYPYVKDAKKGIVNQANEILTQYKASTDKTERKNLERKLKKLQRDMKELVY